MEIAILKTHNYPISSPPVPLLSLLAPSLNPAVEYRIAL